MGSRGERFTFEPTGKPDIAAGKGAPGVGRLFVDGEEVGRVAMPYTVPLLFACGGLSTGADLASPSARATTRHSPLPGS